MEGDNIADAKRDRDLVIVCGGECVEALKAHRGWGRTVRFRWKHASSRVPKVVPGAPAAPTVCYIQGEAEGEWQAVRTAPYGGRKCTIQVQRLSTSIELPVERKMVVDLRVLLEENWRMTMHNAHGTHVAHRSVEI